MSKPNAAIYLDQNNIFFRYKKLDFKKILDIVSEQFTIDTATTYMALDNKQDAQKKFVTYMSNNGWKCKTVDISINTNIDVILAGDMINEHHVKPTDWVILISGDGDYTPILEILSVRGTKVMVIGAKDYISLDLLKIANQVLYIEDIVDKVILD